jgi:VanZ family protein
MQNSKIKLKLLFAISFVMLLIILFFGLSGKGFHFSNNVNWIQYEPGIRFENYGIAYALIDKNQIKNNIAAEKAFSIEIAFKPEGFDKNGFNLLLSLHDGNDSNQLIVGQWRSYIIAMNGDDYSNRKKIKRLEADIFSKPLKKLFLTVTTGEKGTVLYIDGKLIEARSDLTLKIPQGDMLWVTLGNSVSGKNSWKGEVYGLALYPNEHDPETVESHFNAWAGNPALPFNAVGKPSLFFAFDERSGTETRDRVTGTQKLYIPASFPVLDKRFISPLWPDFRPDKNFFMDFIINLLGFIPLGFVLCALFIQTRAVTQKKAIIFSVALCFLLSLGIEIAQAWIPSRSSQELDLILNTLGAFIGALLCRPLLKRNNHDT